MFWRARAVLAAMLSLVLACASSSPGQFAQFEGLAPGNIEFLPPLPDDNPLPAEPPTPPPAEELEFPPEGVIVEGIDATVAPPSVAKLWEGSVELGSNGTDGNSQTFNMQLGAHVKRKTPQSVFSFDATYNYNTSDSVLTANRLFAEERNEWIFPAHQWNLYLHGTEEFDDFRAFDVRLAMDAGLGYQLISTDLQTLTVRMGAGFSQEIGGLEDEMVPEGVAGVSWERKLSARQKITASADYFPDARDWGDFRVNSQANWEILLDEVYNLSLKLGLVDRYDSTPGDAKPNDLNYSAVMLWNF